MVGGDRVGESGSPVSFWSAAECAEMQYRHLFATDTTTAIISRSAFESPDSPFMSSL